MHAHPDLGVDRRLGAYECVGPGWQLNVLLTHVPFGEETKDLLDTLSLTYLRLSLLAPTIVIGDVNAALTSDDRTPPPRHRQSCLGRHALTGPHRPHGRTHRHTLPLPPRSQHPPLPHPHMLRGPDHVCASTRQPTGTSCPQAVATDPSTLTSSSPTHPHPRRPCQTTPSHPHCGSRPRTTTAPSTGITGPYTPSCPARCTNTHHRHAPGGASMRHGPRHQPHGSTTRPHPPTARP